MIFKGSFRKPVTACECSGISCIKWIDFNNLIIFNNSFINTIVVEVHFLFGYDVQGTLLIVLILCSQETGE